MRWIDQQPTMRCSLIVVAPPATDPSAAVKPAAPFWEPPVHWALWRLMIAIERTRLRRSNFRDHLDAPIAISSSPPSGGICILNDKPDSDGSNSADALVLTLQTALAGRVPDLVVQCGTGMQSAELARCARLGALELLLGSSHGSSDGTSGFWEVLNQSDKSAFALRHVSPCGQQLKTLVNGYLPTQSSFLMNQATLVTQIHESLKELLSRLTDGTQPADISQMGNDVVVRPVRREKPTAAQLFSYGTAVAKRALTLRLRNLFGLTERWQVHYKRRDWQQLDLQSDGVIPNPPGGYFADPFLRATPQGMYCFVEEFVDSSQRGVISVLRLGAKGPVYLGKVLDEPFHLSFPYLFEFAGDLYMCPEAHQSKQIRIYKCKSFPLQWELHSVAMDQLAAVDSVIFAAQGLWWMLCGVLPRGDVESFPQLHLFSAPDPLSGQWTPHGQNPLRIDPEFARNGGLLREGERLFRVAQASAFSAYGSSINICEIQNLSAQRYNEVLSARMNAKFKPGVTGLHHIDSVGGMTVWDEKRWHSKRSARKFKPRSYSPSLRVGLS
jgi:hypothetical protein